MDEEQKPEQVNPSITVRLLDAPKFMIEIDLDATLAMARNLLREALDKINSMIQDQEAIEFQQKMNSAKKAYDAMRKPGFGTPKKM